MNEKEREELIVDYLPLANKIAWKKNEMTPKCVSIDELKSAAYMGLVSAANNFDVSRGVAFGTYARARIFGEIIDYLRELNWVGPISEMESLDSPVVNDEGFCLKDLIEAKFDKSEQNDEFFIKITKPLNSIGKRIMIGYYLNQKPMKEIGEAEGIGESRVSQVLKECRNKIKYTCSEPELRQELAA